MKSTKGSFLVASPSLIDPNFRRAVVLVVEHTKEGSFGLVLNRPGKVKVEQLWAAISEAPCASDARAYVGGPVQPSAVFVLHSCADLADSVDPVVPGVYLGSDVTLLSELLRREGELRQQGEEREIFRVFCGYSGWGEGQLDGELETGSWLVQPASSAVIFNTPPERLWSQNMAREGGHFRLFGLMPQEPELN